MIFIALGRGTYYKKIKKTRPIIDQPFFNEKFYNEKIWDINERKYVNKSNLASQYVSEKDLYIEDEFIIKQDNLFNKILKFLHLKK